MRTPQLERFDGPDGRDGFLVRTPFNEGFIEQLKALIPTPDRRWWEDTGAWWVAEAQHDVVRHLVLDTFGEIETIDERGQSDIETKDGQRLRQEGLFG